MNLENTNVTKGALFPMRHRRPTSTQIGQSHFSSPERGARLLAAAGGDADHAQRIDEVLTDLRAHSVAPRSAEVVELPRRPYDRELEHVDELEERLRPVAGWTVAIALSLIAWLALFGAVWAAWLVWQAIR